MASNPVFNRIEREAERGYAGFRGDAPRGGQNVAAGGATAGHASGDAMSQRRLEDLYNQPSAGPVDTGRVTMDDVVMKTLTLFAIVLLTGTVGWVAAAANPALGTMFWLGGIVATLVLGLVIAFKKVVSVPLIVTYAAVEGLFVGAVSQVFATVFNRPDEAVTPFQGIVAQAVIATACVFVGMFAAYRFGLIKVTDKFRRIMTMAIMGYALFAVVNLVFAWVTNTPFGIGGSGMLGIGISVFAVGLASLTLALDFDSIDRAIAAGAPQKYSWLLAHGLIVTLVWLYIEFLRLFARLRE